LSSELAHAGPPVWLLIVLFLLSKLSNNCSCGGVSAPGPGVDTLLSQSDLLHFPIEETEAGEINDVTAPGHTKGGTPQEFEVESG
jgi:hypothetical protein